MIYQLVNILLTKNIRFKTSMLKSDLNDYNDAYILVKERISVIGTDNANTWNKKLTFKNNALFSSCISKTNNTLTGNAEDLDIVMPMHNLLEYKWLRRWVPNPGVLCSKPLGGSKVNLAFHPSEVDQMSTRNFWELSGKK